MAENTTNESVTFDSLRSTHGQYHRPLGDHLHEEEQPIHLSESSGVVVVSNNDETWKIKAGLMNSGHLILTEDRLFVLLPPKQKDVDQIVSVDYSNVVSVSSESGWRKSKIKVETTDGYRYKFLVDNETEKNLIGIRDNIRKRSPKSSSKKSLSSNLVQEIDSAVRKEETAEDLLHEIVDLFAEREKSSEFDTAVMNADSLDELLNNLQISSSNGPDIKTQDDNLPTQSSIGRIREQAVYTAKNSDPADVGKYTLAAGLGFGTFAVTAPFSTVAGLAAITAGGASWGAYTSSHPNSALAQIDPITIATRARIRGNQWKNSDAPGNGGVGAVIGAMEEVSEEEISSDYAQWIAGLDIEKVQKGAVLGARAAERRDDISHPAAATTLGAGVGLAYGYIDDNERLDELTELVDENLLESVDGELEN